MLVCAGCGKSRPLTATPNRLSQPTRTPPPPTGPPHVRGEPAVPQRPRGQPGRHGPGALLHQVQDNPGGWGWWGWGWVSGGSGLVRLDGTEKERKRRSSHTSLSLNSTNKGTRLNRHQQLTETIPPPLAGNLERGLVSCTGSQFCGFALIETKARAMQVVEKLEAALDIPRTVRIHWTGCPNSCGQAQVRSRGVERGRGARAAGAVGGRGVGWRQSDSG